MMTGFVNARREPTISLSLSGPGGQRQDLEGVVDTGFTGFLTLPPLVIAALGLPWRSGGAAILGDGSQVWFDVYEVGLLWDSQPRQLMVEAADTTPLIGMSLLDGFKLTVEAAIGGAVTIEAMP
jgi:clan AA aspartic protease